MRQYFKTKIREYIDAVLSKYSDGTIEFVSDYLGDLANLEVEELVDNEWIASSADKDKRELRLTYLETGSDEDLFSSTNQFDEICEALQLSEKYN